MFLFFFFPSIAGWRGRRWWDGGAQFRFDSVVAHAPSALSSLWRPHQPQLSAERL